MGADVGGEAGRDVAPEAGRDRLFAALELLIGLGMLVGFVVFLLAPSVVRLLAELPWMLGGLQVPGFWIHPHRVAEARLMPSLLVLGSCAALLVCYRWLSSRRRR